MRKALRMHEAKIVLISSRLDPKLHYYADYRLFLCSKENPQIKIANFFIGLFGAVSL